MLTYKLIGRLPVPCDDPTEWARAFEDFFNRRVAETEVGPLRVSTVFLGVDHGFGGRTQLFETMIFGAEPGSDWGDSYCERHENWDDAEKGHTRAVEWAQERLRAAETLLNQEARGE